MPRNPFRSQRTESARGSLAFASPLGEGATVMQPLDLDRVPNQPQPLPGSRASLPTGMGDYLITLKEPTAPALRATRSDIFGQNLSLTSSFRRDLESWLDEHQLTREVAGIGEIRRPELVAHDIPADVPAPEPASHRPVCFDAGQGYVDTPIYWSPDLCPGQVLHGPAIVEEFGATVPLHPGFTARVDAYLNIIVTRKEQE